MWVNGFPVQPALGCFHSSHATQTLRTQIEMVIEALMDNPEKAYKGEQSPNPPLPDHGRRACTASDLVRLPQLNQARVHKCFLALANRKIVTKDASVCGPEIFFRPHLPIFDHLCRDSIVGRASDFPSPFHISHDRRFPSSVTFPALWPN